MTLRLNTLLRRLQKVKAKHGNVEVVTWEGAGPKRAAMFVGAWPDPRGPKLVVFTPFWNRSKSRKK